MAKENSGFPSSFPTKSLHLQTGHRPTRQSRPLKGDEERSHMDRLESVAKVQMARRVQTLNQLAQSCALRGQWGVAATALIQWQRLKSCVPLD